MIGISPILGFKLIYKPERRTIQRFSPETVRSVKLQNGKKVFAIHIGDKKLSISVGYQSLRNGANTSLQLIRKTVLVNSGSHQQLFSSLTKQNLVLLLLK